MKEERISGYTKIHPPMPLNKDEFWYGELLYYKVKDNWFVNCLLVENPYKDTSNNL